LKQAEEVLSKRQKKERMVVSVPRQVNKQRTLVFGNRGITPTARYLIHNLRDLLPHSKKESRFDSRKHMLEINETCEGAGCNNCLYFESVGLELYLWVVRAPHGPTLKFQLSNVHTMESLKLTGNCLKGARPFVMFDDSFDKKPELQLCKELLLQSFGTPLGYLKSKPFIDHIFSFYYVDNKIWFRNYQIVEQDAGKRIELQLNEAGPRFVMTLEKIQQGSFGGAVLYLNPQPIMNGKLAKKEKERDKFASNIVHSHELKAQKLKNANYPLTPLDDQQLFSV